MARADTLQSGGGPDRRAGLVLEVTAVTHRGRVRAHNEDTISVGRWMCGDTMAAPRRSVHDFAGTRLVLVADGMGGHPAGGQASRRAALAMQRLTLDEEAPAEIADALRAANRELYATAAEEPALTGMGTTIAGILALADRIVWFNVGDSRVYSVRQEFLRQLSVDDVPGCSGPGRGRITQALGGANTFLDIRPHVGSQPIRAGRRYLLCSDGLTDAVPIETMERALTHNDRALARDLLDRALAAGARDNVSIVLASVRAGGRAG